MVSQRKKRGEWWEGRENILFLQENLMWFLIVITQFLPRGRAFTGEALFLISLKRFKKKVLHSRQRLKRVEFNSKTREGKLEFLKNLKFQMNSTMGLFIKDVCSKWNSPQLQSEFQYFFKILQKQPSNAVLRNSPHWATLTSFTNSPYSTWNFLLHILSTFCVSLIELRS